MVVVCKHFLIMVEFLIQNMRFFGSYTNVAPETSQTVCVVRPLIGYNGSGRYGGYTTTENRNGVNSV